MEGQKKAIKGRQFGKARLTMLITKLEARTPRCSSCERLHTMVFTWRRKGQLTIRILRRLILSLTSTGYKESGVNKAVTRVALRYLSVMSERRYGHQAALIELPPESFLLARLGRRHLVAQGARDEVEEEDEDGDDAGEMDARAAEGTHFDVLPR